MSPECSIGGRADCGTKLGSTVLTTGERPLAGSGILNVDKPQGMTSHDVVDRVRTMLRGATPAPSGPARPPRSRTLRVGHAGTLDPLAEGVLLLCVGHATRLAEYLVDTVKVYRSLLHLGISTDTLDAEGKVVATAQVHATQDEVRRALTTFVGPIDQIPPMYSAVKRHGVPLHRLARQGIQVARESRRVVIHELSLEDWSPPELTIRLTCSSGTYVRAIARDLGQLLGCGAHVKALTRLACGAFTLEEAISIEELRQVIAERRLDQVMHPSDAAVAHWPAVVLDEEDTWRVAHGQAVTGSPDAKGEWVRIYSSTGKFLAIAHWNREGGCWQPHKVFPH